MISVSPCAENLFKKVGPTSPVNIYLFKVSKRNSRKRCETCSGSDTPERRHCLLCC